MTNYRKEKSELFTENYWALIKRSLIVACGRGKERRGGIISWCSFGNSARNCILNILRHLHTWYRIASKHSSKSSPVSRVRRIDAYALFLIFVRKFEVNLVSPTLCRYRGVSSAFVFYDASPRLKKLLILSRYSTVSRLRCSWRRETEWEARFADWS